MTATASPRRVALERAQAWMPTLGALALVVFAQAAWVRAAALAIVLVTMQMCLLSARYRTGIHRVGVRVATNVERIVRFALFGPLMGIVAVMGIPATVAGRLRPQRSAGWHHTHALATPTTDTRPHRSSRVAWSVVAISLLVAGVTFTLRVRAERTATTPNFRSDTYVMPRHPAALKGVPWADDLDNDLAGATSQLVYTSFTGSSIRDFSSRYVNVKNRERRSYTPRIAPGRRPIEVWFLGGSVVFGFDQQRDDHTIASAFARRAEAEGIPVRVHNFGSPGWVNMQATVLLAILLERRPPPDVVVFLDGINDIAAQAGVTANPRGAPGAPTEISAGTFRSLLANSGEIPGATAAPPSPVAPVDSRLRDPVRLPKAIAEAYGVGTDIATRLASSYGFAVRFYWQPTLFTRDPLDPGEEPLLRAQGIDDDVLGVLRALNRRIVEALPPGVVDLTGAYDTVDGPLFTDNAHTNERGAEAAATAIFRDVRPQLRQTRGGPPVG